jgi:hypothetical protein
MGSEATNFTPVMSQYRCKIKNASLGLENKTTNAGLLRSTHLLEFWLDSSMVAAVRDWWRRRRVRGSLIPRLLLRHAVPRQRREQIHGERRRKALPS